MAAAKPGVKAKPPPYVRPDDPALDFFSPEFDALKALNTPGLQPPNPRVRPLDNIGKCRPLLPGPAAPPLPAAPVDPAAAAEARRAKEIREAKAAAMKAKAVKIAKKEEELRARPPILDVLREKVRGGPLGLLNDCFDRKCKVRVVTRGRKGVRGACTGYLKAFDKYLNIILVDVDEEYVVTVRAWRERRGGEPGPDGDPVYRAGTRQEARRRHMGQVFVKGDAVVLVTPA